MDLGVAVLCRHGPDHCDCAGSGWPLNSHPYADALAREAALADRLAALVDRWMLDGAIPAPSAADGSLQLPDDSRAALAAWRAAREERDG